MARTFYEVLMLRPEADRELITTVYRHLAKRYHPDRDDSPEAATRMAELNEAYATLGDPAKRAAYDRQLGLAPSEGAAVRKGDGRPMRAGGAKAAASESGPYGEAGPPPPTPAPDGRPLTFGRYRGWTLNQVARYDAGYLEWLSRTTMGRNYKRELDLLRQVRRAP
jgi:curved DNA-binding protein CbpA